MRYELLLAWRGLAARPVQAVVPLVVIALALALSITTLALGDAVRRGIISASDPFGVLVVGPKGDAQRLVLSSVLLQGSPIGTIPVDIYDRLAADPRVRLAVPLAQADNIGGAPIIGTTAAFFELRSSLNAPPAFQIAQGRLFEADAEAVLGSGAAAGLGLGVGDTFRPSHGASGRSLAGDIHTLTYIVVGILQPSGTPYDRAVYTSVESVWAAHDDLLTGAAAAMSIEMAGAHESLTAILVLPVGFAEQNQLWQEFYAGTQAQAAFPGQELGSLFDLLAQGERLLTIIGWLVLAIAVLTVFLSVFSTTAARRGEIAIMRSLGGGRAAIFRVVLYETILIVTVGALLGRIIGYGAAFINAVVFAGQSAIPIPLRFLPALEPVLWLVPLGAGILAGLLPAVSAYSVDIVENLSMS